MKFSVGYQLTADDLFMEAILREKEQISEVYFSWGNLPNGRRLADLHHSFAPWETRERTIEDLSTLSGAGIDLNLLLNGACYGGESLSKSLFQTVCDTVDEVGCRFGLRSVTTTSPDLAHLVRVNFPDLEVRASVNMCLRDLSACELLTADFDGFYMARELNRNLSALKRLSDGLKILDKKRYILANSGCLNFCPARPYHDNLVAHEEEIMKHDNAVSFRSLCSAFLAKEENRPLILSRLNLIRPEDLPMYEGLADGFKLATRVSSHPAEILTAYTSGRFSGNLFDLTEPDHARHFYPAVLDNSRIPEDFGKTVSTCTQDCSSCGYCRRVYEDALIEVGGFYTAESGCCDSSTNQQQ